METKMKAACQKDIYALNIPWLIPIELSRILTFAQDPPLVLIANKNQKIVICDLSIIISFNVKPLPNASWALGPWEG
uniref:Uncharacterized protein n=1 Tax=Nelumbo nucifera TaxID=4432 RepID=A0A822Z301_NELNU|nr:TPA_asm: hypothetical protein HUJ06_008722 [Nelumbo nucifera]